MTAILPDAAPEEYTIVGEPRTLTQIIADVQATNEPLLIAIEGKP